MAAKLMHQTKVTLLISLNAVALLIVGVMIFSAVSLNGGIEFRVVSERSDTVNGELAETEMLEPGTAVIVAGGQSYTVETGEHEWVSTGTNVLSSGGFGNGSVSGGELWSEDAITMYQTADFDICAGGGLTNLGDMYWQTSNPAVIKGFYNSARTWLGSDPTVCRYPAIVGTGTVEITAGTYDGARYDKLTVTVIPPPVEQWKRDVLNLVNQERARAGLAALGWSTSCEGAANIRAREIVSNYSHTRPNGASWSTACTRPAGGIAGENLAAGNAAVSPETVVASWMNSEGHRANILNPNFKYMAVGFVFDSNSQNKTHWSQYFTNY